MRNKSFEKEPFSDYEKARDHLDVLRKVFGDRKSNNALDHLEDSIDAAHGLPKSHVAGRNAPYYHYESALSEWGIMTVYEKVKQAVNFLKRFLTADTTAQAYLNHFEQRAEVLDKSQKYRDDLEIGSMYATGPNRMGTYESGWYPYADYLRMRD